VPGVNRTGLPLPPLIAALRAAERGDEPDGAIATALRGLATHVGLRGIRLALTDAEPLRALEVGWGTLAEAAQADATPIESSRGTTIGWLWLDGPAEALADAEAALVSAVAAAQAHLRADRAEANLAALDQALHGIAGAAASGPVLQLIVERVRELADAQYAALGLVGAEGEIAQFLTSGIDAESRRRIGALPKGHGLLGALIREGESIRIPDIGADPRRYGFPPNHPEMRAFLGVPIRVKGRSVGNLYLTNKRGQAAFSAADQELVERFALHAGIAFENARLAEEVAQLRLIEERERIGADLHDGVIQRIYGANLFLEDVAELIATQPADAASRVEEVIEALNRTIEEIRAFIFVLRAPGAEVGIGPSLRTLASEVRLHSGLEVVVSVEDADDLEPGVIRELLSIAREALSNVARHAAASSADVGMAREAGGGGWRLEIRDDGVGFDPALARTDEHRGLANMRRRAERLGGTLRVESAPAGGGSRIIVTLPGEPGRTHGGTGQGE
jgi:signal transduction histidine kinase